MINRHMKKLIWTRISLIHKDKIKNGNCEENMKFSKKLLTKPISRRSNTENIRLDALPNTRDRLLINAALGGHMCSSNYQTKGPEDKQKTEANSLCCISRASLKLNT